MIKEYEQNVNEISVRSQNHQCRKFVYAFANQSWLQAFKLSIREKFDSIYPLYFWGGKEVDFHVLLAHKVVISSSFTLFQLGSNIASNKILRRNT